MLRKVLRKLRDYFTEGLARTEDVNRLYDQLAGLVQIQAALTGNPIVKQLRDWALSPDAIAWILCDLQDRSAPVVVEFGSGQSTAIVSACLKHKAAGRLISVEHDNDYAESIRKQLQAIGTGEFAEFHIVPLVAYDQTNDQPACHSYDLTRLPATGIDVALIDGPPLTNGATTRFHPLLWAFEHLNEGGSVYLDDSNRPGEQQALQMLKARFPTAEIKALRAEKGLTLITRKATDGHNGKREP